MTGFAAWTATIGASFLVLALGPKGCGKSAGDDGGAVTQDASVASPTESASAAKDSGTSSDSSDGGAGDGGNAAKGTLPPKIDAPPQDNKDDKGTFMHFDAATLATKVHGRDPMLDACYTSTGKEPGYWAPRCYDLHFSSDGVVTSVTGKSTDPLGLCIKGALLGVQLGTPKDKAAGKAGICMSTR